METERFLERELEPKSLYDMVCEIIESYGVYEGYKNPNECIAQIETLLTKNNIKQYIVTKDEEVYNDAGIDIYYVVATWLDNDNKLRLCGGPVYSC